jgi:hypothetical protein
MVGKEAKFRPSRESDRLVGFPPPMGIYNMWGAMGLVDLWIGANSRHLSLSEVSP